MLLVVLIEHERFKMSLGSIRLDTSIDNLISDDDEEVGATVKKVTRIRSEHNDKQRNGIG